MMPRRIDRVIRVSCILAAFAVGSSADQLSDKIHSRILETLPKFEPPSPGPPGQPSPSPVGKPAPLSADPLVVLPVYHIREKKESNQDPDQWLSRRALDRKAMSEYRDSMNGLEWALNCWYIPFITASPQTRANAAYAAKKSQSEQKRLTSIATILATLDPAEAKKLLHDLDFSSHPDK